MVSDINDVFVNVDHCFDYVDLQWGFCFVRDPQNWVQGLKTILKPGAVVFFRDNFPINDV